MSEHVPTAAVTSEPKGPPPNLLDRFGRDGKDRSHIPPLPPVIAGLRIGQLVLNLLVLILAAVSASEFGTTSLDCYGFTFFTFAWTLLFFGYIFGTTIWAPELYHIYAHMAAEFLTNLWWLVSWALCASAANDLRVFRGFLFEDLLSAAAGIGALQWLLFCATLALLVMHFLRVRKNEANSSSATAMHGQSVEMGQMPAQPVSSEQQPYYGQQQMYDQSQQSPYPQQQTIPTGPEPPR